MFENAESKINMRKTESIDLKTPYSRAINLLKWKQNIVDQYIYEKLTQYMASYDKLRLTGI